MSIRKLVTIFFPHSFLYFVMNVIMRCRYDVRIGRGSRVRLDSKFEGPNTVLEHSDVFGCEVGRYSYIANHSSLRLAKIGRFCCIGDQVRTMLGRHPTDTFASIHNVFFSTKAIVGKPFVQKQLYDEHVYIDAQKRFVVEIGNDVWIGNNVSIMDGVKIGDGAVIATGAVVTKDVEPYAIVGGVPAKLIKYRFTEEQRQALKKMAWWNLSPETLATNAPNFANVSELLKKLSVS